MRRQQWVFFDPCGCPFGVVEAVRYRDPIRRTGAPRVLTKTEAWKAMYDTAKDRNAAFDRGVVSELMGHDRYVAEVYPKMRLDYRCPHEPAGATR